MLDAFLKVACSRAQKSDEQARFVGLLQQLPEAELFKLASGEEKLAYHIGGGDPCWLDKFKGTPLLAQAVELEKQDLEQQMSENTRMREDDQLRSERNAARDEIAVHRRLLELQLVEHESGGAVEPEGDEPPAEGAAGAPDAFAGEETPEEEELEHGPGSPEVAAAEAGLPPHGGEETPEEEAAEGEAPPAGPGEIPEELAEAAPEEPAEEEIPDEVAEAEELPDEGEEDLPPPPPKKKDEKKEEKTAAAFSKAVSKLKGGVKRTGELLGGSRAERLESVAKKTTSKADYHKDLAQRLTNHGPTKAVAHHAGLAGKNRARSDFFSQGAATERKAVKKTRAAAGSAGGAAALGGSYALGKKHGKEQTEKAAAMRFAFARMKMAGALQKEAVGLGSVLTAGKGVIGAIGKGMGQGRAAFQTARGAGGSAMGALGQAAGPAAQGMTQHVPGALKTLGKASLSYAKANPAQAAGIAGGTALAGYGASRMLGND